MKTDGLKLVSNIRLKLSKGGFREASRYIQKMNRSWRGKSRCGVVLSKSSELGYFDIVDLVVQSGVSIDTPDQEGYTALEVVAYYGLTASVHNLLARGANPSRVSSTRTALQLAAFEGHFESVKVMIDYGADINDIAHLRDTDAFRIQGRILRYIRQLGGKFDDSIEDMLDNYVALGDF